MTERNGVAALRAPFPWFGGKSRAASLIWERFGDAPNLVEPFAGSLAVLLARPHPPRVETVNDKDAFLSNFWRALQADPQAVARHADNPVSEPDLHAWHLWLVQTGAKRVERLMTDPEYYDVEIAGRWAWGLCQWIGSGWCVHPQRRGQTNAGRAARGILAGRVAQPAHQLPHLGNAGMGVHRPSGKLPHLHHWGMGIHAQKHRNLHDYFEALAARLRYVRVCCGDWTRVLGPSVTEKIGITGILLDPPYSAAAGRDNELYRHEDLNVAHDVREWALANGDNPRLRIALCGYESEGHEELERHGWECVPWKAGGGYGSNNKNGNLNAHRERIWFNPSCLKPIRQMELL